MIRVTHRRKTHFIDPAREPSHLAALEYIWDASKLTEEQHPDGPYKWRKLGFLTEDVGREFVDVGVLGLDCLVRFPSLCFLLGKLTYHFKKHFACKDPDYFATVVTEQISRPPERRCPIARASNEIVELLSEHWAIFAPGCRLISGFRDSLRTDFQAQILRLRPSSLSSSIITKCMLWRCSSS